MTVSQILSDTNILSRLPTPGGHTDLRQEKRTPVGAFCDAMNKTPLCKYEFIDYDEHAISVGSDSKAISYIQLKNPQGKTIFGIGVSHNIGYACMKGVICAINRDQPDTMRDDTMPGIFDVC